tara:strand:+ start:3372 stop:3629 length:258 start_codon:yes stop_codon:yes gene_type:complete
MDFKVNNEDDFHIVGLRKSETTEHKCFSDQALGAIMLALQNSLMHQTDIVPVLKALKLADGPNDEIIVLNPPILRANSDSEDAKV